MHQIIQVTEKLELKRMSNGLQSTDRGPGLESLREREPKQFSFKVFDSPPPPPPPLAYKTVIKNVLWPFL